MLIIARKVGEKFVIGDGHDKTTVVVIEIRGDKVRLGLEAPREIPIHRQEIQDIINKSRQDSPPSANLPQICE